MFSLPLILKYFYLWFSSNNELRAVFEALVQHPDGCGSDLVMSVYPVQNI